VSVQESKEQPVGVQCAGGLNRADKAWFYIVLLTIGYVISHGLPTQAAASTTTAPDVTPSATTAVVMGVVAVSPHMPSSSPFSGSPTPPSAWLSAWWPPGSACA
jgi:hypothetical protein